MLVKEPKLDKFCTPYHPVPLTVTSKNHSMLTAEGSDRKVTRNYSYFKKLFLDTHLPLLSDALEETSSDKDIPHALIHPVSSSQDHANPASDDTNSRTKVPKLNRC